jgi:RNA polymerase primary sigma factor
MDETNTSPELEMLFQARRNAMEKLLSTLNARQAEVIKLHYGLYDGDEHSLAQIGKIFGLSRERIRKIEAEALSKLRHPNRRCYWQEIFD